MTGKIRTCEQYVLAELAEARQEIERLERENGELKARVAELEARVAELEAPPTKVERRLEKRARGLLLEHCFSFADAVEDGEPVPFDDWCVKSILDFRLPSGIGKAALARFFEPELKDAYEEQLADELLDEEAGA